MGTYCCWASKDYEKHSSGQQQWARELISKLSLDGTEELAVGYLEKVPLDTQGKAHVAMVRHEVEAQKPQ